MEVEGVAKNEFDEFKEEDTTADAKKETEESKSGYDSVDGDVTHQDKKKSLIEKSYSSVNLYLILVVICVIVILMVLFCIFYFCRCGRDVEIKQRSGADKPIRLKPVAASLDSESAVSSNPTNPQMKSLEPSQ